MSLLPSESVAGREQKLGSPPAERHAAAPSAGTALRSDAPMAGASRQGNGIAPLSSLSAIAPAWRELSARSGGGVGSTLEWAQAWCNQYLQDRELLVFKLGSADALQGMLPMILDTFRIGGLRIRIAKLLGGDSVLDHCDPPCGSEIDATMIGDALDELVVRHHCDVVAIGPLPDDHVLTGILKRVRISHAVDATPRCRSAGDVITRVRLPASFDEFLGLLGRDERKAYRRRLSRFYEVEQGTVTEVSSPAELRSEFPAFMNLHAVQWRASGKLGHFGDWPGSAALHSELIETLGSQGAAYLVRLAADGKPVGYQYALSSAVQSRAFLLARDLDERYRPYGLGTIAFYTAVERAIREGKKVMDVGRGKYEYKLRHGAEEVPLHSFVWVRNKGLSRLRARALTAYSAFLHKAYYRAWFGILAPRLPFPRRPLWRSYLRTRL